MSASFSDSIRRHMPAAPMLIIVRQRLPSRKEPEIAANATSDTALIHLEKMACIDFFSLFVLWEEKIQPAINSNADTAKLKYTFFSSAEARHQEIVQP